MPQPSGYILKKMPNTGGMDFVKKVRYEGGVLQYLLNIEGECVEKCIETTWHYAYSCDNRPVTVNAFSVLNKDILVSKEVFFGPLITVDNEGDSLSEDDSKNTGMAAPQL